MSEATSGVLPAEGPTGESGSGLKVCTECGRGVEKLTRKMCGTCYMRVRRGGGVARRVPLDPEIAVLLLPVPGTSPSFAERVFTYVDASGDCWEWTGAKDQNGYGVIGRGGRGTGNMPAHCAAWSLLVGPIPDGMQYDHLCRRHDCVFPGHGEIVTAEINKARGFSPGSPVLQARHVQLRPSARRAHQGQQERKDDPLLQDVQARKDGREAGGCGLM